MDQNTPNSTAGPSGGSSTNPNAPNPPRDPPGDGSNPPNRGSGRQQNGGDRRGPGIRTPRNNTIQRSTVRPNLSTVGTSRLQSAINDVADSVAERQRRLDDLLQSVVRDTPPTELHSERRAPPQNPPLLTFSSSRRATRDQEGQQTHDRVASSRQVAYGGPNISQEWQDSDRDGYRTIRPSSRSHHLRQRRAAAQDVPAQPRFTIFSEERPEQEQGQAAPTHDAHHRHQRLPHFTGWAQVTRARQLADENQGLPLFSTFRAHNLRPASFPGDATPDVCSLCLEPYDEHDHRAIQIVHETCHHIFGNSCLEDMFNHRATDLEGALNRCPICRTRWFRAEYLTGRNTRIGLASIPAPGDFAERQPFRLQRASEVTDNHGRAVQFEFTSGNRRVVTTTRRPPADTAAAAHDLLNRLNTEANIDDATAATLLAPTMGTSAEAYLDELTRQRERQREILRQELEVRQQQRSVLEETQRQLHQLRNAVLGPEPPVQPTRQQPVQSPGAQRGRPAPSPFHYPSFSFRGRGRGRPDPGLPRVHTLRSAQASRPARPHTATPLPEQLGWPDWFPADTFSDNAGFPQWADFRNGGQPFPGAMWYVMTHGRTSLDGFSNTNGGPSRQYDAPNSAMRRVGDTRWHRVPLLAEPHPSETSQTLDLLRFQQETHLHDQRIAIANYLRRRFPNPVERMGPNPFIGPMVGGDAFVYFTSAQHPDPIPGDHHQ